MKKVVKIPKERISVVIGNRGVIKRRIEKKSAVTLEINEEVVIDGDAVDVMVAGNIITAIGRGFSPEIAFELLKEDKCLIIIPIAKDEKTLNRVRSRLIGTDGKARRNMERLTNCYLSVYGKTVAVIGEFESVEKCQRAIEKLISGAPHRYVYDFLER